MEQVYLGLLGGSIVFFVIFTVINLVVKKFFNTSKNRPPEITTLCAMLTGGLLVTFSREITNPTNLLTIDLLLLLLNSSLSILVIIGIWKMKRWGFMGYILFTIMNQFTFLIRGYWSPFYLVVLLPIFILLIFFPKKSSA